MKKIVMIVSILNLSSVSAWTAAASQAERKLGDMDGGADKSNWTPPPAVRELTWEEDQEIDEDCIPEGGVICPPAPPPSSCNPKVKTCPPPLKKKAYFIRLVKAKTFPRHWTRCVELMNEPPDRLVLHGGPHANDDGSNGGFKDGDLLVWFQDGQEVLRSPLTVVSSKRADKRITGDVPRAGRYLVGVVHGKNPGKYMWSRSVILRVADRGGCPEGPTLIRGGAGKK